MSNQLIYDVCADAQLLRNIRTGYFDRNGVHPRKQLGDFGSLTWWDQLTRAGLVKAKNGRVSELVSTGHGGNFPEFVLETDEGRMQFERKGKTNFYQVGRPIRIFYAKEGDLFDYDDNSPYKTLKSTNYLLRVEAVSDNAGQRT